MNHFFLKYKKIYSWFALVGILAIGFTSSLAPYLKRLAVTIFHGVTGLLIFLVTMKGCMNGKAPTGFEQAVFVGALIGFGGIALAFFASGKLLPLLSEDVGYNYVLATLLLPMMLAFTWGFMQDLKSIKTSSV